jgi:hypothetical protein
MRVTALAVAVLFAGGCSQLYYASMEKLGKEKRDILVQRVMDGKKDQEKAKEQIKTTLEVFQELTGFEGGNLEKMYRKLNSEYEEAQERADAVTKRIDSIEKVGNDLFAEWEKEIAAMQNRDLKLRSQKLLRDTRQRHGQYLRKMRATEKKMQPVLRFFRDQVTFLKHNLNAKAVGSLKETSAKLDGEVAALVADLEGSIAEADIFIKSLKDGD